MTRLFKHFSLIAVALGLMLSTNPVYAAANAAFSFAPDSSSIKVGDQVKVTINVTASEFTAYSTRFKVNYDSSLLDYASEDSSNTGFPNSGIFSTGSGVIEIARYTNSNGFAGSGKITALVFRAKATGNASFSFSSLTIYDRNGAAQATSGSNSSVAIGSASTATPKTPPTVHEFSVSPDKITKGSSAKLKWSVSDAAAVSIDQGVGSVSASSDRSVSPSSTTKYTLTATSDGGTVTRDVTLTVEGATSTPKSTPKPTAKATVTPTPAATAPPTEVSAGLSSVTFSSTTAIADGVDTITVTATIRNNSGSVIPAVEPTLTGLRDAGDSASPFVYDENSQSWSSQITSNQTGLITATVSANDTVLSATDLTFTEPLPSVEPSPTTTQSGGGFGRTLLIGFIVLLLLLVILFFLWRKLRHADAYEEADYGDGAFPGDEAAPAEGEAATTPAADEEAAFNPDQTLQRKESPPANEPTIPPAPPVPPTAS